MINAPSLLRDAIISPSRQIKGRVLLYAGDTQAQTTYSYADALQSIEISRMGGDNKFFGFGICQTATIKLKDKDNQITIKQDDYFTPQFGAVPAGSTAPVWAGIPFPQFFVEDIQKDEVNGTLTITAGDKLHNLALQYRVNELDIEHPYTIRGFAEACAIKMGLTFTLDDINADTEFNYEYPEGANFDGEETLKEALDAVAEATQTIYYIKGTVLHFKSLWQADTAVCTVDKSQYFSLQTKSVKYLGAICSATELGENIIAHGSTEDATQYVWDNPFWDMLDSTILAQRLEDAMYKHESVMFNQFSCSWRGNFLLEIGDMVGYTNKDGSVYTMPFLNDTITYDGGFSQTTSWSYDGNESETLNNPTSLGGALKQTFAKVDKVNKQIDIVASETTANRERISELQINTETINASVSQMEQNTNDALVGVHEDITTLKNQVNASITAEDVRLEIETELANGVDKVVTSTGFTFNEEGLTVAKTGTEMKTTVTEDGMTVYRDNTPVLTANHNGVDAANLHATTYLIIGTNSRFEDYNTNRTGCFWIGG